MRNLFRLLLAATVLVFVTPMAALACPVCGFVGTGDNNAAYRATTVALSAVPLGMIAGIAVWLARRAKRNS